MGESGRGSAEWSGASRSTPRFRHGPERRAGVGQPASRSRGTLVCAFLLVSCTSQSAERARAPAADSARVTPPPAAPAAAGAPPDTFVMPAPPAGWHVAADTGGAPEADSGDMGIGIIELAMDMEGRRVPRADTLRFHVAPDSTSPLAGAWILALPGGGAWRYATWAPERLTPNDLEFGYEENGIPFDSADATGRWRRGILGFTERGERWYGWARLRDSLVRAVTWREHFIGMPLYFRDGERGDFHASPSGPVVTTVRILSDSGFDMEGIELRGEWMKVKVEHPGQMCDGNASSTRRTDHYWIRAFDRRGRPRVFYHTRGC